MNTFAFHSELFEVRANVTDILSANGIEWFSDYDSVDLVHDAYGIEVVGIRDERVANRIHEFLCRFLPDWRYSYRVYDDKNHLAPGWFIRISRDPNKPAEKW
jgi:hypothetical protein